MAYNPLNLGTVTGSKESLYTSLSKIDEMLNDLYVTIENVNNLTQLSDDLDLNENNIIGIGNITLDGTITAETLLGTLGSEETPVVVYGDVFGNIVGRLNGAIVDFQGEAVGEVLTWNGNEWRPQPSAGSINFNTLLDVTLVTPVNNHVIKYDSATQEWYNSFINYSEILGTPTIPSKVSDITNDLNFVTSTQLTTAVNNILDSAPAALNTLNELAAALGDDPNFATTVISAINLKADASSLGEVALSDDYNDLINTPVLAQVAISGSIDDLIEVSLTAPISANQVLKFDGTNWINQVVNYTDINGSPTNVSHFTNDSDYATETYVDTSISSSITSLIDSAPAVLNTLNELAAALGDDPNFATTVSTSISLKANIDNPAFTGSSTFGGDVSAISGISSFASTTEKINTKTGAVGFVEHDYATGSIWYHTGMTGNFAVNLKNLPTTNNRSISIAIILTQGSTPYVPNALQIENTPQTINWIDGINPVGTSNKYDIVNFTLIRVSNNWVVFGTISRFG
jgi:hypothetical protein